LLEALVGGGQGFVEVAARDMPELTDGLAGGRVHHVLGFLARRLHPGAVDVVLQGCVHAWRPPRKFKARWGARIRDGRARKRKGKRGFVSCAWRAGTTAAARAQCQRTQSLPAQVKQSGAPRTLASRHGARRVPPSARPGPAESPCWPRAR